MQDLTLVGVHDDGEHLVLSGSDGQRFRVRVDEPLRAAVRRDRARLGQLQIELDGRLRPRDIQARIRAGQTAQEIAEAAGLPIEHVRRYEGPVLAEREFVVRQARAVRIRRSGGAPGGSPTLGDLVAERLAAREVDEAHTSWDAWRSDDGAWVVSLAFSAGSRERQARWTYDASLRHVTAQDDEARWLTEDEPSNNELLPQRRLVPIRTHDPLRSGHAGRAGEPTVHDRVYDVEADGGVRPIDESATARSNTPAAGQVTGHPSGTGRSGTGSTARPASATVDLLDSLRERRGRRQRPQRPDDRLTEDTLSDLDALDSFETASPAGRGIELSDYPTYDPAQIGEPPGAHPARSRPDLATDAEVLALPEAALPAGETSYDELISPGSSATATPVVAPSVAATPASPATPTAATPPAASGARRGKRASVPSWDDIVFGSRRD